MIGGNSSLGTDRIRIRSRERCPDAEKHETPRQRFHIEVYVAPDMSAAMKA
jgi:hypothetical protein